MKWKKNKLGCRKWYGNQRRLPIGHKKWAGDCLPCPVGSAVKVYTVRKTCKCTEKSGTILP